MTTNHQLSDMINKLNIKDFRGWFMCDELKSMTPNDVECGIVNFESSKDNGSHWVAYAKFDNRKYYFDSYGSPILPEIKDYLRSPILCYDFVLQTFNATNCGELCVLFLYLLNKQIPYEDVILSLLPEK